MISTVETGAISLTQFKPIVSIKKHSIDVDPKITNLFTLSVEQLAPIIKALNLRYEEIERSEHPAEGYRLYFRMLAPGKRPLEIELDQFGERKSDEQLKLPPVPQSADKCEFCAKEASNKYPNDGHFGAKVIMSTQGNPLSVPTHHYSHFFAMPPDTQIAVVMLAINALQRDTLGEGTRATIYTNIGTGDDCGHQNYGHTHMHFEASTGRRTQT